MNTINWKQLRQQLAVINYLWVDGYYLFTPKSEMDLNFNEIIERFYHVKLSVNTMGPTH